MLTEKSLQEGLSVLIRQDTDLAAVLAAHGPPPLWGRQPGFPTLVRIILEQQVSLSSAKAAFDRLNSQVSSLTPQSFLSLSDDELKRIGFSRQKSRYCRELSTAIIEGCFDVDGLEGLDDVAARKQLMGLSGVGLWTADIYLLMALRRPDVWPSGDLALAKAVQQVKKLSSIPDQEALDELAQPWRPWRAVAARILWHHYLSS